MPAINLDPDFFGHIKTRRLVGILGPGSELYPIRLWCYCGKHHQDGRLLTYSAAEIESIAGWNGEPGRLIEALEAARDEQGRGFLVKIADGWEIPNWETQNGHLLAYKVRGRAAANARWGKLAMLKHDPSNAPTILTKLTTPSSKEEGREPVPVSPTGISPSELIDLWNEKAPPALSRVLAKSKSRIQKAAVRITEHPARAWWESVLQKIAASPFLIGDNDRGWRMDFDWLTTNDKNCLKIMEGKYDRSKTQTSTGARIVGEAKPEPGKYDHLRKTGPGVPALPKRTTP